jgi:hypothetical protein
VTFWVHEISELGIPNALYNRVISTPYREDDSESLESGEPSEKCTSIKWKI